MRLTWTAALKTVPTPVKVQAARFIRIALLVAVPQLLAAAADPRGLTLKTVAAVVSAGLEVAWRQVAPATPDSLTPADPAPSPAPGSAA